MVAKNQVRIGCKNFKGLAKANELRENDGSRQYIQLRCKQWNCAYCAVQNAKQWRAVILDYINKNRSDVWTFLTFTMRKSIHAIEDKNERFRAGAVFIKNTWDTLSKRLKRAFSYTQYVRVIEVHKSGTPHIHVLVNCHIPARTVRRRDGSTYGANDDIKKMLTELKFGFIYDVKPLASVDSAFDVVAVASYVAKYITKDTSANDEFRRSIRLRKIQTSRGIKRVNVESKYTWTVKSGLNIVEYLDDVAEHHIDITTNHVITVGSFLEQLYYPPELPDDE